jgi:hypothetical protein
LLSVVSLIGTGLSRAVRNQWFPDFETEGLDFDLLVQLCCTRKQGRAPAAGRLDFQLGSIRTTRGTTWLREFHFDMLTIANGDVTLSGFRAGASSRAARGVNALLIWRPVAIPGQLADLRMLLAVSGCGPEVPES